MTLTIAIVRMVGSLTGAYCTIRWVNRDRWPG